MRRVISCREFQAFDLVVDAAQVGSTLESAKFREQAREVSSTHYKRSTSQPVDLVNSRQLVTSIRVSRCEALFSSTLSVSIFFAWYYSSTCPHIEPMESVLPCYNPSIMAQVPNHDAHQWTHSIPLLMPWSLNQQQHQDIIRFTGHANSFAPQLAGTCVPNAYSSGHFYQVQPQPISPQVPLANTARPTSFSSPQSSAFVTPTAEVPGHKRHGGIDEDLAKLQPAPKIFVTAEKVTSDLGRLSLNQSSHDSPINEQPVIDCEVDEDSNDEPIEITVSDDVQEILNNRSIDPLMGLGQKESDKICKAVVVWQPPKPISVKVESIVELPEDDDLPAATDDNTLCHDIEFEEVTDDLEAMGD